MNRIKIEGNIEFSVVEQTPERVVAEMPIQEAIELIRSASMP